jgi:NTP pyrophosphatase (non-canonical NTP hydrolase)
MNNSNTTEKSFTHQDMVRSLKKSGADILADLNILSVDLLHMVVGISGEAGELLDAVKKHAVYNKPLDRENVIEELGDLEFYMEGLRQSLNISREETIQGNINKLSVRYNSGKYSNAQAQERLDKK